MFYLRCLQLGLSFDDLEQLDYGFVIDMLVESGNDSFQYKEMASQKDFDSF